MSMFGHHWLSEEEKDKLFLEEQNDRISELNRLIFLRDEQIQILREGTDGLQRQIGELKKVLIEYRKRFGKL